MLTYEEVTSAKFSALQESLASHGLKVTGNTGVIKKLGAIVQYNYTPSSQTLTVDVEHAPWTVKLDKFTATIDDAIKTAIASTGNTSSSSPSVAPNSAASNAATAAPSAAPAKEAQ